MSSAVQLEGIITDRQVVVHPLVLLSAVDHYNRIAQGTNKRVVGALLGEYIGSNIDVTNAYAVPFEEDPRDSNIWFLDHNFHESMYLMFRKVNAKESIVGWYSTGPKIKPADLKIHEVFRRYCAQPVYVIIDVKPKAETLPTDAYFSLEEPTSNKMFRRTFVHIPSTIGATEPEEVGVEHLLRDIKNANTSTLSTQVMDKLSSLKQLIAKLKELQEYLKDVIGGSINIMHYYFTSLYLFIYYYNVYMCIYIHIFIYLFVCVCVSGKLPPNPKILYNLQVHTLKVFLFCVTFLQV
eukprot:GHVR01078411.1.p2 GENE.GHVR01078411.1~~GHVR01078411.1.p2  ORF type:complete len:294 (-),score=46.13 GHVR01078411.1:1600-2481(-)